MTEPGLSLLLTALGAYRRTSERRWPNWRALCPCHGDRTPSLNIDYKPKSLYPEDGPTVLVNCKFIGCRADLLDVCKTLGIKAWDVLQGNEQWDELVMGEPPPPARLPSHAMLVSWRKTLSILPDQLDYLRSQRGLTDKTIEWAWVGWDLRARRYTLPVYESGELVNLRKYDPDPPADRGKMEGLRDRSVKYLYPNVPPKGWLLLCEGEWDALLARQYGFRSVGVSGVNIWDPNWNKEFAGRDVAIVFDCDESGREYAQRRAKELRGIVKAVKVVDLGLGDKEDITDWFVSYKRTPEDLRLLIKRTPE